MLAEEGSLCPCKRWQPFIPAKLAPFKTGANTHIADGCFPHSHGPAEWSIALHKGMLSDAGVPLVPYG